MSLKLTIYFPQYMRSEILIWSVAKPSRSSLGEITPTRLASNGVIMQRALCPRLSQNCRVRLKEIRSSLQFDSGHKGKSSHHITVLTTIYKSAEANGEFLHVKLADCRQRDHDLPIPHVTYLELGTWTV